MGISLSQLTKTSSGFEPVRAEMVEANPSRRAVRVYPGQTLFTVMPSAAYSLASVRARPVTAARTELERSNPSTGCFTAEEVMVIRRPHLVFCMRGKLSLAKKTVLIKSCSTAERQSSGLVFLKELDGGPPELVTQISRRPKRASTAATKDATAAESVTSRA